MKECYVIYATHYDKQTKALEGSCTIYCVDTLEKVYKYFDGMVEKYNAKYVDEYTIHIDHEAFLFLEDVSYERTPCDFGEED